MWMLFIGELRRRWVEYALGALAIALVVGAIVAGRAVADSAESSVHDLAHKLGRNMLVVPAETDLAAFYGQRFGPEALAEGTPDVIRASPLAQHLRSIETRLYGSVDVKAGKVLVVGEDVGWPSLGDVQPAVLGPEAARTMGAAAGSVVQIRGQTFSVLQVADPPPEGLESAVFMPLAAAQRVLGRPGEISAMRLGGCWCRIDVAALAADVERLLPGTRAITVAGMVEAQKGTVATMQRYSGLLQATGFMAVAAVVAALVASQARRRTRELGLLVAVGAPPLRIAATLMAQAAVAGALGAVLGWAAAIPAVRHLGAALLGSALPAPAGLLAPAVALTALVSAAAAFIPAYRCVSVDPTVTLRES